LSRAFVDDPGARSDRNGFRSSALTYRHCG
jgi:hypothetical protein